jgi:thiamine-phosphate pyrophosphorylase
MMLFNPQKPLIYLITSGSTNLQTTPATEAFSDVLRLVEAAVAAQIDLLQIREKNLSAGVLYQLATSASAITRGTSTKLLVNDRSDIAVDAGADGVHLTTQSMPAEVVRQTFGPNLLIGVSTHSTKEAATASVSGADFVVFGPIFETVSKCQYGEPLGLTSLNRVTQELGSFPVLALGGITVDKVAECIRAGARGIAAIRMLNDLSLLGHVVNEIRSRFDECHV